MEEWLGSDATAASVANKVAAADKAAAADKVAAAEKATAADTAAADEALAYSTATPLAHHAAAPILIPFATPLPTAAPLACGNPFLAQAQATLWTSSVPPPRPKAKQTVGQNRWAGQRLLEQHFSGKYFSTALWWDAVKGKKATSGQLKSKGVPICFKAPPKHDARFPHPAKDFYIQCSSLFVVDLDKDTELSRQALAAVGTSCNCVAATPRGVHLYFAGAIPDLRGKQLDGLDVRTGDGNGDNKQPDIIFCAPSWYATPTGDAKYEWIVLPQTAADLLPPPPALLNLLRAESGAARATQGADHGPASDSTPPQRNLCRPL